MFSLALINRVITDFLRSNDEISWFAHQSKQYRTQRRIYAYDPARRAGVHHLTVNNIERAQLYRKALRLVSKGFFLSTHSTGLYLSGPRVIGKNNATGSRTALC